MPILKDPNRPPKKNPGSYRYCWTMERWIDECDGCGLPGREEDGLCVSCQVEQEEKRRKDRGV